MKIILLGYMASGKSTIGKLLAKKMNLDFIDLDEYIENKEQLKVSEIFNTKGEIYFRKQEHLHLKELLDLEGSFVLSLGGGTPCYAGNMDIINAEENVNSFYINVSIGTITNRLTNENETRPLVANISKDDLVEFVAKHLFERSFFYNQSKFVVKSDDKEPIEIVDEIYSLLA
ncbi:shikimate kinase [Tenacibaculum holothuriorum]|uniref:Shikimate kinase n=1 Tax=Tenacibaculum holothuriorum TaxID=1635173 RepID=A0A1Y2PFQ1_9FLAO|nr:shikimate kinase [Tenacibaculum holothuriorum]OSY89255.1 shikimate kinase [Tenacibaculum holothuriorum]